MGWRRGQRPWRWGGSGYGVHGDGRGWGSVSVPMQTSVLDRMRCHLAETLVWSHSQGTLYQTGCPGPPREGEIWGSEPQFAAMLCIAKLHCLLFLFIMSSSIMSHESKIHPPAEFFYYIRPADRLFRRIFG